MLANAGKKVVLSTLTLLESESELSQVRKVCDNHDFMVEANDMSAVKFLSSNDIDFCTGPSLNIYNAYTLKQLVQTGSETLGVTVGVIGTEAVEYSAAGGRAEA